MPRALLLAGVLVSVASSAALVGQSPTPPALAEPAQAESRIRALQAEADRLAAQAGTLLGELRKLELERQIRRQALRAADAELAAVTAEIEAATRAVDAMEAARAASTPGVRERLIELYKRGRGGYVRLLLAADDLRALGRLSRGVAAVAELDQRRFDAHRDTVRAQRASIAVLEARRTALAAAQAEALAARRALDTAVATQTRRLTDLDAQRDLTAQYLGELQSANAELQRRASALTSRTAADLPLAPFRGTLPWPADGTIVSRFGRSGGGRLGALVVRNGIEIATADGAPIRAVHPGRVTFAAPFVGFGALVILDHGANAFTLYGHLQDTAVTEGLTVPQGGVVGRAGRSPDGREVLYFELRIDGRAVDPVEWLKK